MNPLEKLYELQMFSKKKYGLKNMYEMQRRFGFPERNFRSIHVAGTNGKGSVVCKIGSTLEKAGYGVGRFTSPHISSFSERIQINGESISSEILNEYLEKIFKATQDLDLTFFEVTTQLAFMIFSVMEVDFAVVEVGLGGRVDATNLIHPILTVITSISLDHTLILGESLEKIAYQKAGIIKPKVALILGPTADREEIRKIAKGLESPIYSIEKKERNYEEENQEIALCALKELKKECFLPDEAILWGIKKVPRCRFEIFEKEGKNIVFDVAHNPEGFDKLIARLQKEFPQKQVNMVMGFSHDKDIFSCLTKAALFANNIVVVPLEHPRAASVEQLEKILKDNSFAKVLFSSDIKRAIEGSFSREEEVLVVCGSFYLMNEALSILGVLENVSPL